MFASRLDDIEAALADGDADRIGACFDNAVIESFWGRMQTELPNCKRWKTRIELANAIFEHLEIFPKPLRQDLTLRPSPEAAPAYLRLNLFNTHIRGGPQAPPRSLGSHRSTRADPVGSDS
ncbi:hypothetical protein ACSDR0_46085 [Streptosporangium sp. G11]|uniref:hypothetical protein n=1 Tax=Streptosporangium sp. G11 TaxID=3436926 RepID=UPI003EB7F191